MLTIRTISQRTIPYRIVRRLMDEQLVYTIWSPGGNVRHVAETGHSMALLPGQANDSNVFSGQLHPFKTPWTFNNLNHKILFPKQRFRQLTTTPYHAAFSIGNGVTFGAGFCDACHKSHFTWLKSQDSGEVPVSKPIFMDISAVIDVWPFRSRERWGRDMPRRVATSPILISAGKNSRRTSPGCAGLCIRILSDMQAL